jgi:hypothetical protein
MDSRVHMDLPRRLWRTRDLSTTFTLARHARCPALRSAALFAAHVSRAGHGQVARRKLDAPPRLFGGYGVSPSDCVEWGQSRSKWGRRVHSRQTNRIVVAAQTEFVKKLHCPRLSHAALLLSSVVPISQHFARYSHTIPQSLPLTLPLLLPPVRLPHRRRSFKSAPAST